MYPSFVMVCSQVHLLLYHSVLYVMVYDCFSYSCILLKYTTKTLVLNTSYQAYDKHEILHTPVRTLLFSFYTWMEWFSFVSLMNFFLDFYFFQYLHKTLKLCSAKRYVVYVLWREAGGKCIISIYSYSSWKKKQVFYCQKTLQWWNFYFYSSYKLFKYWYGL